MSPSLSAESHQPLANELLILTIHHCRGDKKTLYTLNLVNSMFRTEAQPLLYSELNSSQPKTHDTFINILTTQKQDLIKQITKYDSSNIEDLPHPLWTSMMNLIAQMDNLQELGLRISDGDYHRAEHPFRPIIAGWNPLKLIPETPRFKLRSLRLRRKATHLLGVGWWVDLIRAYADTLECLDMSDIRGLVPPTADPDLHVSYPRLRTVKGERDVIIGLLPGKQLRVVECAGHIRRFDMSDILLELTRLEAFSSRYVCDMAKGKASGFLDIVSRLDSVKYLGVAHELAYLSHIQNMLNTLPTSGRESLQAITLLWNRDSWPWNEKYYHDIRKGDFMFIFKMCPSLRFIDIELPPNMGLYLAKKPYQSTYHRVECRNPGQLYRFRYNSFQPDAVLHSYQVSRAKRTFHYE